MARGENYDHYLMRLLNYPNLTELRKFLNEPERPSTEMRPPNGWYQDVQELVEAERRISEHLQ